MDFPLPPVTSVLYFVSSSDDPKPDACTSLGKLSPHERGRSRPPGESRMDSSQEKAGMRSPFFLTHAKCQQSLCATTFPILSSAVLRLLVRGLDHLRGHVGGIALAITINVVKKIKISLICRSLLNRA